MEPSFNKPDLSQETIALREAWMRHDDAFLKDYLISDVEDPRIHFPSIFTRGMIAEALFPEKFRELIWEEYRFGICLSYIRVGGGHGKLVGGLQLDCSLVRNRRG